MHLHNKVNFFFLYIHFIFQCIFNVLHTRKCYIHYIIRRTFFGEHIKCIWLGIFLKNKRNVFWRYDIILPFLFISIYHSPFLSIFMFLHILLFSLPLYFSPICISLSPPPVYISLILIIIVSYCLGVSALAQHQTGLWGEIMVM